MDLQRLGDSARFSLDLENRAVDVLAGEGRDAVSVVIEGVTYEIATARPQKGRGGRQDEEEDGQFVDGVWSLRSPITGSVVDIRVTEGDVVEQGTVVMVVEAMKMQNELRSRVAGRVSLKAEKGQRVETGSVLAEVTAPEA